MKSYTPKWGEIVDLDTMQSEYATYKAETEEKYASIDNQIESLTKSLKVLTEKYAKAKAENRLRSTKRLQNDIIDAKALLKVIIDEL